MAKRKSFLLRLQPEIHQALQHWAEDEFRSLNGQIEYLLRQGLRQSGRLPKKSVPPEDEDTPPED